MGSTLSSNVVYGIDLNWPSDIVELEESSISRDSEFYAEFFEGLDDEYETPDEWEMEKKITKLFPSLAVEFTYYGDCSYGAFLHFKSREKSEYDGVAIELDPTELISDEGRDDLLAAAKILGVKDAEPAWFVLVSYG